MYSNLYFFMDGQDYLKPQEQASSIANLDSSVFFHDYSSEKLSHFSSDLNYFDSYEHELLMPKTNESILHRNRSGFF